MTDERWTPGAMRAARIIRCAIHKMLPGNGPGDAGNPANAKWLAGVIVLDAEIISRETGDLRLVRENERLREALGRLSNEIIGSLPLGEDAFREALGNTNYAILLQRAHEARAALAEQADGEAKGAE